MSGMSYDSELADSAHKSTEGTGRRIRHKHQTERGEVQSAVGFHAKTTLHAKSRSRTLQSGK